MAKYLLTGGQNLRLPAETDLPTVRQWLESAFADEEAIELTVEMNDDPLQRMQVRVNPAALGWWGVCEISDDGTSRVIG